MGNYTNLKNLIDQYITTNGQGDITGAILNNVLKSIVNSIGADFLFAGVAEPTTNPGSPDQNVFYIAIKGGTYTNFGNVVIPNGITIFKWNGSWSYNILFAGDGGVFDISAFHNNTKYANLTAALGTNGANVPQFLQVGGLSIKFVQSANDRYVQYRLTANTFSTTVTDWQGIDEIVRKVDDNYPYFQPNMLTPVNMTEVILSNVVAARNYDKNGDINAYVSGAYSSALIEVTEGEVYYIANAVAGGTNGATIIFYDSTGANRGYMYDPVGANYIVIQNKVVWVPKGVTKMRFCFNPNLAHVIKKGNYNFVASSEVAKIREDVEDLDGQINGISGSNTYTGSGYDFNVALAAGDRLSINVSEHTSVVSIYGKNADNSYTLLKNVGASSNVASIDITSSFIGFRTYFYTSGTYSISWKVSRGISKKVEDIESNVSTLQSEFEEMAQKIDTTFVKAAFRKVLCVGDSVTHGLISDYPVVGYNTALTSYPVYLGKITGWNVKNAGHSSWNTKEWYNQWFANYNYADYDLALIEFGYNRGFTDTLATDAPLAANWVSGTAYSVGNVVTYQRLRYKCVNANTDSIWTPANWTAGYADYADTDTGDYCRIIEGMLAQNPALCIAIVIPARFYEGWSDRNVIEAIANRYALPIVDLHSDKYFNLNATEYHGYLDAEDQASGTLDLTHFNALGYLAKAESLYRLFCDALWSRMSYFNANIENRLLAIRDESYNYDYEGYINMP